MRFRFTLVVGMLVVSLSVPAVAGASPVGSDQRISGSDADRGEGRPSVAFNPAAGQYLVVWEDTRNEATRGWDIYGRPVDAKGRPVAGESRISAAKATGGDYQPSVAHNPSTNQYLVVWADTRDKGTRGYDIYGRRVGADSKPIGGDLRISTAEATGVKSDPSVAHNPSTNQYLVVWADDRNKPARGSDVYGRPIGGDGKPIGDDFRISGKDATGDEWSPAVAYNPAHNRYLVVWADTRDEPTRGWDIFGRRVAG